jgi:hypothetical protein
MPIGLILKATLTVVAFFAAILMGAFALFPAAGVLIAAFGSLIWVFGWKWRSSRLPTI